MFWRKNKLKMFGELGELMGRWVITTDECCRLSKDILMSGDERAALEMVNLHITGIGKVVRVATPVGLRMAHLLLTATLDSLENIMDTHGVELPGELGGGCVCKKDSSPKEPLKH